MNLSSKEFILILSIAVVSYYIFQSVQSTLTSRSYITTVYGYIILGILLLTLSIDLFERFNMSFGIWGGFILAIVSMIAMQFVSRENILVKHLFWLLFIIGMGMITYPMYVLGKESETLNKSIITTVILMLVLSYIAYSYPLGTFNSWFLPLFIGLLALIIFQVLDLLFGDITPLKLKIFNIVVIIIFVGFVLYDTQNLVIKSTGIVQECANKVGTSMPSYKVHGICGDYPSESLGIFLDILNLFSNISSLNMSR